jgi:hypothetical protein
MDHKLRTKALHIVLNELGKTSTNTITPERIEAEEEVETDDSPQYMKDKEADKRFKAAFKREK